ncbi:hypothetical protein ERO13_D12G133100v2 [Gossypium hirsutum]|nr:hypothetical protein ERO13_D12G133100v2 [Gossypium hirsutum]
MIAGSQYYFFFATFYCEQRDFSFFQSGGLCQSLSSPRFLFSSAFRTISGIPLSRLIPSFTACNPAYASAVNGSSMLE